MTTTTQFPINLGAYKYISLNPADGTLTAEQREALKANIQLCRDAIVFFTATGAARGVGGHTGEPYDTVPEVMILDAFFRGAADQFVPIFFDEAGLWEQFPYQGIDPVSIINKVKDLIK